MKKVEDFGLISQAVERIKSKGAFLVARTEDNQKTNVMTIGWTALGYMWRKPIMIVMVRKSRYTFQIIEKASSFTVNVPLEDSGLDKALTFCGTKSGKDIDKFQASKLIIGSAKKVNTPVIKHPGMIHYECKIIFKSTVNPDFLCSAYREDIYPDNDFHTIYFGEILTYYRV